MASPALADCTVTIHNKSDSAWTYKLNANSHPDFRYQTRGALERTLQPGETGTIRYEDLDPDKRANVVKRGRWLSFAFTGGEGNHRRVNARANASFKNIYWATDVKTKTNTRCFYLYEDAPFPADNWKSGYISINNYAPPRIDIIRSPGTCGYTGERSCK